MLQCRPNDHIVVQTEQNPRPCSLHSKRQRLGQAALSLDSMSHILCIFLMLPGKASIHEYLGVSWKVDGNVQEYMREERLDGDHNRPSRVLDLVMNLDVSWKVDENVQEYRREVCFD